MFSDSDSPGMRTTSPPPIEDTTPISIHSRQSISSHFSSECQSDCDSPEYYNIEISEIDLSHVPTVGWNSLDDRFFLQIVANEEKKETSVASRGSLSWRDKFTFNVHKSCDLTFKLYARRHLHADKFMGAVSKRVDKLVTHPHETVFKGWYDHDPKDDLKRTTLICRITRRELSLEEVAEEATLQQLCISNIIIRNLPKVKLISLDDHFFVQIEVDGEIACITDVQRGHSLQWNNAYLCNYRKHSRIQLKVFSHRHIHHDHVVCAIEDRAQSFLQCGFITQELSFPGHIRKEHDIPATIEFHIALLMPTPPSIPSVSDDGVPEDAITPNLSSVEITDIRLDQLPKIGMVAFNDHFYVQLVVESMTQSTSLRKQHHASISWNDKYIFHVPETAFLLLQVHTRQQTDEYIGMVRGEIGAFLQGSGYYDRQLMVLNGHSKKNLDTKLSFRIKRSSPLPRHSGDTVRSSSAGFSIRSPYQHACEVPTRSFSECDIRSPHQHAGDNHVRSLSTGCDINSPQQHASELARIPAAKAAISTVQSVPQSKLIDSMPIASHTTALFDNTVCVFKPLLSRISIFVRIGRVFSEAHPYTKLAFMVLTAGYEVIQQQLARDESIRQLTSVMCESYGLVLDAADLCRFRDQEETITLLARQTIECAYFIRGYALHKSGAKHCITNLFSGIDATISNYKNVFRDIRTTLEQKVVIKTQLVVWRIHDALNDIAAKVDLNALPYANGASYHAQKNYDDVPTTELEDHLAEIFNWVNDQSQSHSAIYLLIGSHGSEASAIAHTVARQFDYINRLGSSYCFDRTRRTRREPTNLFSTIARDLADHNPEFMTCLGKTVKSRAVGSSPHIPTQFRKFILSSAQQLTSIGPTLVVIDALDACGTPDSRADVLAVLKEEAQHLPPSFKFLITCRSETDVAKALRDRDHIQCKELDANLIKQLSDKGFAAGRIKLRPPTPPIQTEWSHSEYFPVSKSASSASDTSSTSPSSLAPSIFDGALRTLSPDTDISSPASSIIPYMDAGSPQQILSTIKRIEEREESISLDADGQQTVTITNTKRVVKQHRGVAPTPRHTPIPPPVLMLAEPNAQLFITDPPTVPAEDIRIPQNDSPCLPRKKHSPRRAETILRSDTETTGPQPITLLSP